MTGWDTLPVLWGPQGIKHAQESPFASAGKQAQGTPWDYSRAADLMVQYFGQVCKLSRQGSSSAHQNDILFDLQRFSFPVMRHHIRYSRI